MQETAAEFASALDDGSGDWERLYALLCGLALTAPPPPAQLSEAQQFAREHFPDILDPYDVAQAEAAKAAKLLADRGLTIDAVSASDDARPTGDALVARDSYGSRFLVTAPFGYHGETDHWYAWDIDQCWTDLTVAAGTFGSADDALAEWQENAGAPAVGSALEPCPAPMLPALLGSCLRTGPMSDTFMGGEPRDYIREYYRMRRRARALAWRPDVPEPEPFSPDAAQAAFGEWHAARHENVPDEFALAVGTIIDVWGPHGCPDERAFYACSPHRLKQTALLLREGYQPDYANESLTVLPEWTQWCLAQSNPGEEFAARAMETARAEAAALVDPSGHSHREGPSDGEPIRRPDPSGPQRAQAAGTPVPRTLPLQGTGWQPSAQGGATRVHVRRLAGCRW